MTDSPRSEPTNGLVSDLLEQVLACPPQDWETALAERARGHPQAAASLRRRFDNLRALGLLPGDDTPAGPSVVPERLGEFELRQRLGGGGMGVVYQALQTSLQREVALKLVRPELLWFDGARERFVREAEAIARLQHPGIVQVYTAGEAQGVPYMAMELVKGRTLAEALMALAGSHPVGVRAQELAPWLPSGSLVVAAARIVCRVAEALAHAHAHGVLHRDVKPSNVMLSQDGRILLLDFGLAFAGTDQRLTRSDSQLGSFGYAAPEQVFGDSRAVDARADVFALGCVLYEALTLRPAFLEATPQQTLEKLLRRDPAPPGRLNEAVPRDLCAILDKALEKEPARRYATMQAFAADLAAFLEHRPVSVHMPSALGRLDRAARRDPKRAGLVAALPLVLVLGGYLLWTNSQRSRGLTAMLEAEREDKLERGFFALKSGRADEAKGLFESVLTADPKNREAQLGLGEITGQPLGDVDPRPVRADELWAAAYTIKKNSRRTQGQADLWRSVELLRLAQQRSPQRQRPLYHFELAEVAGWLGDAKLATSVADTLLDLWPAHPLAWFWAGEALLTVDPERAQKSLEQAVKREPKLARAWRELGVLNIGRGLREDAMRCLDTAVALEPDSVESWIDHSSCALELGRYAVARGSARRAVDLAEQAAGRSTSAFASSRPSPRPKPGAFYQLGRVCHAERDERGALEAYTRAVEVAPDYWPAWQNLAVLHQEAKRPAQEVQTLEDAVAKNPGWALGWQMLSHALRRAGRDKDAVAPLARYVDLCPQDEAMKSYLIQLEAEVR